MIKKYIKKPIPIEAVLLTEENMPKVLKWMKGYGRKDGDCIIIHTREGAIKGCIGRDYIAKGIEGEFYPIKKEIFEKTYDELNLCKRCRKNPVENRDDICQECIKNAISGIKEVAGKHIEQVFTADEQIYVLFSNGEWEYR